MLDHLKRNAIAYLALFVALGGVSWAAVKLPRNSVGANQVKSGAIRSAEVKDRALLARDFKAGQLPAGNQGAAGPQGPQGQQGAIGPTFADVGGSGTLDPAATPEGGEPADQRRYIFTLPTAGRVLLEWRGRMSVNCTVDPGNAGLYIDGAPVPKSGRENSDVEPINLVGLTGVLPAGPHTAHVRVDCPSGDANSVTLGTTSAWSAVLVGS